MPTSFDGAAFALTTDAVLFGFSAGFALAGAAVLTAGFLIGACFFSTDFDCLFGSTFLGAGGAGAFLTTGVAAALATERLLLTLGSITGAGLAAGLAGALAAALG